MAKIAIVGAGNVGSKLGLRLTEVGEEIVFGVRAGKDISELLQQCGGKARAASVEDACQESDVIFLAVPGEVVVESLASAGDLTGKIVVDCNNPVAWDNGPVFAPPPEGSLTAQLARAYPGARCVKGFATFGAEFHRDPSLGDTSIDVHLAGDDKAAKAEVAAIAERAGYTVIDCGPLRNAAHLEAMAVLWIHLAMMEGRGRFIGFKLLERPETQ